MPPTENAPTTGCARSATRTAVVVGLNYGPDHDPLEGLADKAGGNVSVYARGRDYHDLIKKLGLRR